MGQHNKANQIDVTIFWDLAQKTADHITEAGHRIHLLHLQLVYSHTTMIQTNISFVIVQWFYIVIIVGCHVPNLK